MPYVWKTFEEVTYKLVLPMLSREVRFYMKRLMHIIILLALYNICGFCLKYSLPFLAVLARFLFLISAWIGMFVAVKRMIIVLLENRAIS